MKRLLLILAAMLTANITLQAQRTVSGTVVDSEQKEAVIQATVALLKTDSTMAANAVTSDAGHFTMTAPADGKYIVRITYVGYKPYYQHIAIEGKPLALGTVAISADSKMLKNVDVVKNMAKVTTKDDTITYNAGAYRTPEGSVIEELVKKLPGAEVADDGSVTINGKKVQKVLIDGKEFMTGDTKTAIKNLPTSIVERVRTYDEKSDLARVTGVDDGEEQTVLDFGLKKGMNRGMFANVDAGVGTKKRYSGRAMGAMMKDNLRAMAFLNANNTNDMGFGGGGGGGRFGGGGRNGLQASKMVGLNINYEKKNLLKLDGSVRWNHNDADAWSRRASENFVSTTGSFSNSVNQNYSRSNSWNAQMRVEWTPDTLWNLSFRPSWSYSSNDGQSNSTSATFSDDPYDHGLTSANSIQEMVSRLLGDSLVVNYRDNSGLNYSDTKRFGGNLQLNRKLGGGGRNITLRLSGNHSEGESKAMSASLVNLYQRLTSDSTYYNYQKNRYNLTPQNSSDFSVRLTYSEPIFQATFLQFSYNFQYRHNTSSRSTYDFWKEHTTYPRFDMSGVRADFRQWDSYFDRLQGHSYDEFPDDSLSRYSEYNNYIHTGEIMLRIVRKSYNFHAGVQIVPQSSRFRQEYQGMSTDTTRHVVNWSPTANFRWKISERGQMRFEYRGSTSQPSMTDLLDITDDSDPLNITKGNPGLKPSFTQRFSWRYNNYFERHQRFVNANFNFSTTSNGVARSVVYDPVTGGRTSQPKNINGNWNIGGNFVLNTALDTLGRFNINTSTDLSYANSVGYIDLLHDGNESKSATHSTTVGERLGGSYRNDWLEVELNGRVQYNYVTNKLQPNSNLSTWAFNYGFNATAQMPWGMQLTTSLNMSSRRGYSDAAANTNELIWNAQIAQSFLRGRNLSLRLEFYDILQQQSNFSRTINAMMRTDNEYNAINSYVMLRATYRLNLFGTREMRQGMRRGDGDGDRPGFGGREGGRGNRGGSRGGFGGGGFGGPGRM